MDNIRGKAAIVGIGEVPTGMYPERSYVEAAVAVSEMAIKDSGIPKGEIDTVIPIGVLSSGLWTLEFISWNYIIKGGIVVWNGTSYNKETSVSFCLFIQRHIFAKIFCFNFQDFQKFRNIF